MEKIGDHLGEHLEMERGEANAWPHVIIGATVLGLISGFVFVGLFEAIISSLFSKHNFGFCTSVLSLALTGVWIYWIYLDRWRVNEAYSSRFVTHPATLAYVWMISIGYALSRVVERMQTKFAKPPPPPPPAP